jgi:hypothetical protein
MLSSALSEAMEGVLSWIDPIGSEEVIKLAVDPVFCKRLA